jgi:hypothetical protein
MAESKTPNEVALGLARQLRDAAEAELAELEGAFAQSQFEYDALRDQARKKNDEVCELGSQKRDKSTLLYHVGEDIRDLMRPREAFPQLNDAEYEERMQQIRFGIQAQHEERLKRSSWSE